VGRSPGPHTKKADVTLTLFRPEAEADLDEAYTWYESQRRGLGMEFLEEASQLTARIESTPLQFPIVYRDARRALMHRFPYAYFFRASEELTLVVTVADLRREPSHWQRRL